VAAFEDNVAKRVGGFPPNKSVPSVCNNIGCVMLTYPCITFGSGGYLVKIGETVARKKRVYGRRYSETQKRNMVHKWMSAASQTPPMSKNAFVKANNVSAITLNGWIERYSGAQVAASETVIVMESPTRALALTNIEDDFAVTMQAIRDHQASIAELRERLRQIVDAL
jgi:hypothetical protein